MLNEPRILPLQRAIFAQSLAVDALAAALGPAVPMSDHGDFKFRYAKPTPQHAQVLKAVRYVSAMNAGLKLLEGGFYAEIIALMRMAQEYLSDITFIHEGLSTGTPTAEQQRFVEHFFAEHGSTAEELIQKPPRGALVERKKVHASHGRQLQPNNPHRIKQMFDAVESVLSGYVHGSYSSVMELYEGGTNRFRTDGMLGTPRVAQSERQMILNAHRAFNVLREIAWSLRIEELFNVLRAARLAFEKSSACAGMKLSVPESSNESEAAKRS